MEVNILFLVSHTGQPALRSASLCLIRSFPKWPPVFAHRYVMRTGTNTHTHTHSVCQGSLVCFGNFGPGCQSPQVVQGTMCVWVGNRAGRRWWRTSGGDDQQVPLRLECSRSESQLDFLLSRRVKTPNHSLPQLHNLFIPQTSTTQISSHALSCTLQFFSIIISNLRARLQHTGESYSPWNGILICANIIMRSHMIMSAHTPSDWLKLEAELVNLRPLFPL